MTDCLFCKIINKEIPCTKIYEDEHFIAFFDIKPVSDGHILIIPKEHIMQIQDADDQTLGQIFVLAKKLIISLKIAINCDFVQVTIVGEQVPHFHVHLIPRYHKDGIPDLKTKSLNGEKTKEIIEKMQA